MVMSLKDSKAIPRPKMGQKIRVSARAEKFCTRDTSPGGYSTRFESRWQRAEIPQTEVIYIGWRTVSDCDFRRSGSDYDYDENMERFNYRRVYLVVGSERENPFHVFPEDVEAEE
jgi:hypothetical protein